MSNDRYMGEDRNEDRATRELNDADGKGKSLPVSEQVKHYGSTGKTDAAKEYAKQRAMTTGPFTSIVMQRAELREAVLFGMQHSLDELNR